MNHLQLGTGIGTIALTWSAQGLLSRIDWYSTSGGATARAPRDELPKHIAETLTKLESYFDSGEPIGAVPWEWVDTRALSDFQNQVYRAISEIPHGETRTYAWVARRVGKAAATRAVGQALRKNPFPILVPCHRVVSETALGGFMGVVDPDQPELDLKRRLIELEGIYRNPMFPFVGAIA